MSSSIDNRIVQMTFDNKQFESGVQTSLNTLSKLTEALKFKDTESRFSNIAASLESLNNKFSTLGIIGANVVSRLTQEFMNNLMPVLSGVNSLINSMTVNFSTLSESFGKYEQMVSNQQTIMSAVSDKINKITGEKYNMEDVAGIIDRLRWYTDETSYNLDQMVSAIGDFTSSGRDLAESEKMVLGIANACADAGISADKADIAMRGFSRAIGSGGITLQIWNTMLKTSGLTNSEKFKQSLLDAAEATGTLIRYRGKLMTLDKKHEVTLSTLTETLTEYGWANTEVLTKVLAKYSNTVDGIYALTHGGKIDLSAEAFSDLNEAIKKATKSQEEEAALIKRLGLDEEYDQASEAIQALVNAYTELGLEVPQSLKAFEHAQEAISWSQALEATAVAVKSQWARTFELIFGNYEEAKKLWTGVSNSLWGIFAGGGDDRNEILSIWHDKSYESFSEGIVTAFGAIETAMDSVRETIKQIIADRPEQFIEKVSESVSNLTDSFVSKISSFTVFTDQIKAVVELLSELGAGNESTRKLLPILDRISGLQLSEGYINILDDLDKLRNTVKLSSSLNELSGIEVIPDGYEKLYEVLDIFGGNVDKMFNYIQALSDVRESLKGIIALFDLGKQAVSGFWRATEPLRQLLEELALKLLGTTGSLGKWLQEMAATAKETDFFYNLFSNFAGFIKSVAVPVFNTISHVINSLRESLEPLKDILDSIKTKFEDFIKLISGKTSKNMAVFTKVTNTLTAGIKNLTNKLKPFVKLFAQAIKNLLKAIAGGGAANIANAGYLGTFIAGLKKLLDNPSKIVNNVKSITGNLSGSLGALKNVLTEYQKSIKAGALLKIAVAVGLLAISVKTLSGIDPDRLSSAVVGLGAIFAELIIVMKIINNMDSTGAGKKVKGLLTFAAAVLVLTYALKNIADLSLDQMIQGIAGIGLMLLELVLVTKYAENFKSNPTSLLAFSAAILILAAAMKVVATIDSDSLLGIVITLGAVMAEMVGVFAAMNKWGGGTIKMVATAASIAVMSASILVLAAALKILGTLADGQLTTGLTAIGVSLGMFVIAANMMKDTLPAAAAILVISAALALLVPTIVALSIIPWSGLAKGFAVFGVALAAIVISVNLLKGCELTLIAFGAAVALVGAGVLMLATALTELSMSSIVKKFGNTLNNITNNIGNVVANLGRSITALFSNTVSQTNQLIEVFRKIINSGMLARILGGIVGAIKQIAELVPAVVSAAVSLAVGFIVGILEGLTGNMYRIVVAAGTLIVEFVRGITEKLPDIIDAAALLVITFIEGVADAIINYGDRIIEAIDKLIKAVVYFLVSALEELLGGIPIIGDKIKAAAEDYKQDLKASMSKEEGAKIGSDFGEGMTDGSREAIGLGTQDVVNAALNMSTSVKDSLSNSMGGFKTVGAMIPEGVAKGIENNSSTAITAAGSVATKALRKAKEVLKIESPSKAFMEVGKYADEGFAQGFTRYGDNVEDAASNVATSALTTFADLVSDEIGLDPVITPVLDLSKIQNGARNISSMFGTASITGIGSIGQFSNGTVNDTAGYSPTVNVTIYASEGQSSDDLYNTFTRRLNNDVRRRSLVWDH